jgi:hypothetical protein
MEVEEGVDEGVMNLFRRVRKHTFGEPEEPSVNIFLIVVATAAVAVCLLIYALLARHC